MAKVREFEKPYELTKADDDLVIMDFKLHDTPETGWCSLHPVKAFFIGLLSLLTGPGAIIGLGVMIAVFIKYPGAKRRMMTKGSEESTFEFRRDEVRTPTGEILKREGITEVFKNSEDTSFTYRGPVERNFKQLAADFKANNNNFVTVTYGTERLEVTYKVLSKAQANDIAYLISQWLDDPDYVLEQASASSGAEAAA